MEKQNINNSLDFLTEEECGKIESGSRAWDYYEMFNQSNPRTVELCWIEENDKENVINFTKEENRPYKTRRDIKETLRIWKKLKDYYPVIQKNVNLLVPTKEDYDNCEIKWRNYPGWLYGVRCYFNKDCSKAVSKLPHSNLLLYINSELPYDFEKYVGMVKCEDKKKEKQRIEHQIEIDKQKRKEGSLKGGKDEDKCVHDWKTFDKTPREKCTLCKAISYFGYS